MRILFDQGTPVPLRSFLVNNHVETAFERGWNTLKNGALLVAAEREGFEILLTTDRNLRYQQNLTGVSIAIIVLSSTSWPHSKGNTRDNSRNRNGNSWNYSGVRHSEVVTGSSQLRRGVRSAAMSSLRVRAASP